MPSTAHTTSSLKVAVSRTHIVIFGPGIDDQGREDILHSTLLAQLAAHKAHDAFEHKSNWFGTYAHTLGAVGWSVQSTSSIVEVAKDKLVVSPDITIAGLLHGSSDVTGEELHALTMCFLYLKGEDPVGFDVIQSHGLGERGGMFQLAFCSIDESEVTMKFLPVWFGASEKPTSVLFERFQDAAEYHMHYLTNPAAHVLNLSRYAQVRDLVAEKLDHLPEELDRYLDEI